LQQILENLRLARPGEMQNGGSQAMRQMDELMQRQQQLLDRSFRRSQQGTPQGDEAQGDANDQEMLRQMLGDMMQQMTEQGNGDIPAPMARADRAMKNAVDALRHGAPGDPIGPQTDALDALQEAARAMQQQMMGRSGGEPGDTEQGNNGGSDQAGRDPFGRLTDENDNGGIDDGGLMRMGKVNDTALERAKRILEELRERDGERTRPELELNYIDRLLKQF
jgi:Domain of unknown function (DUF4175)